MSDREHTIAERPETARVWISRLQAMHRRAQRAEAELHHVREDLKFTRMREANAQRAGVVYMEATSEARRAERRALRQRDQARTERDEVRSSLDRVLALVQKAATRYPFNTWIRPLERETIPEGVSALISASLWAFCWLKPEALEMLAKSGYAKPEGVPSDAAPRLALCPAPMPGEVWRHVKRGSVYTVLHVATAQAGTLPGALDGSPWVVYLGTDGAVWVRPVFEFCDGRFVRASDRQGVA